jgi:hypothetical protein
VIPRIIARGAAVLGLDRRPVVSVPQRAQLVVRYVKVPFDKYVNDPLDDDEVLEAPTGSRALAKR